MSLFKIRSLKYFYNGIRQYTCSAPQQPRCGCPPQPPPGQRIQPPADCRPGPIPPNPCVPKFPGKDTWQRYRNIVVFICFPLMFFQAFTALGHQTPSKTECREYEYMRRRTKRFPWGRTGNKSLFHNPRCNYLPGECGPPPLDCD
ncbi:hypothetical protein B5X24_HaOG201269 [Helicoverpa armigera]|nr:hypothetical protein B5X24_HaOG201269 [Helicoverpa armigera]